MDRHPGRDAHAVLRLQLRIPGVDLPHQIPPGAHRPLGVVLVCPRMAEVDQHPVPQVLGHATAVALDHVRRALVMVRHHLAIGLRAESLGKPGRIDEVAEEHREVAALAALGQRTRARGLAGRDRKLPAGDLFEPLDQGRERHVALLGFRSRDRLEELPEPVAP